MVCRHHSRYSKSVFRLLPVLCGEIHLFTEAPAWYMLYLYVVFYSVIDLIYVVYGCICMLYVAILVCVCGCTGYVYVLLQYIDICDWCQY